MICPRCKKDQPNVGPWKEPGEFTELCGPCKVQVTMTKPGVKERLERDIALVLAATQAAGGES